jgi:hypothetical protein
MIIQTGFFQHGIRRAYRQKTVMESEKSGYYMLLSRLSGMCSGLLLIGALQCDLVACGKLSRLEKWF